MVRFDAETWGRMVELVNFLRIEEMEPEARDRLGRAIVNVRLRQQGPLPRFSSNVSRRRLR